MLSHWKQEVQFLKQETLFKNRLKWLEPAKKKVSYKQTLKISLFILSTNIRILNVCILKNLREAILLPPYLGYKEISK